RSTEAATTEPNRFNFPTPRFNESEQIVCFAVIPPNPSHRRLSAASALPDLARRLPRRADAAGDDGLGAGAEQAGDDPAHGRERAVGDEDRLSHGPRKRDGAQLVVEQELLSPCLDRFGEP